MSLSPQAKNDTQTQFNQRMKEQEEEEEVKEEEGLGLFWFGPTAHNQHRLQANEQARVLMAVLTLVAAVLKARFVIVLVSHLHGEGADTHQRLVGLVSGRH